MRGRRVPVVLCGALAVVWFALFSGADDRDVRKPPLTVEPLEPGGQPVTCSTNPPPATPDPIVLAIDALEQAQAVAEDCGNEAPDVVVCRGLWAAWVLDPVVVKRASPSNVEEARALSSWALEQAAGAANDELAVALSQLSTLNGQLSDPTLAQASSAELIRRRAVEEIVEPLQAAETHCNDSVGR